MEFLLHLFSILHRYIRTQNHITSTGPAKASETTTVLNDCNLHEESIYLWSRHSSRLMSIQSFRSTLFLMRYEYTIRTCRLQNSHVMFESLVSFESIFTKHGYWITQTKNQSTVSKLYIRVSWGLILFSLFRQKAKVGRRTRYSRMLNSEWPSERRISYVCGRWFVVVTGNCVSAKQFADIKLIKCPLTLCKGQ